MKQSTILLIAALGLTLVGLWAGGFLGQGDLQAAENRIVIEAQDRPVAFDVELAATPAEREQGLMYRSELAKDAGMLFRFDRSRVITMWMKNTFIPLDMIFIDEAGKIVSIHEGAKPHSLKVISSKVPARYVLEVLAGQSGAAGLRVGQQARHPWFGTRR